MESLMKNPYRRLMEKSMREAAGLPPSDTKHTRAGSPVFTPTTFDTNIVIITAALLLVLICALGMNALIKCLLNWTRRLAPQQEAHHSFMQRRRPPTGINKTELKLLPTTIYHHNKPLMPSHTQKTNTNNGAHNPKESEGNSCHGKVDNPILQTDHHDIDQEGPMMQDSQCAICLSDFQDGEKIRVLPLCNHGFHMQCVDAWLCNHSSCPTCRADLTPNINNATANANNNPILHPQQAHVNMQMKKSTQVQLEILISPAGTLTPTIYRVMQPTSSDSSLQRVPISSRQGLEFKTLPN